MNRFINVNKSAPAGVRGNTKNAALEALNQALIIEEYECCADLVKKAKEAGADKAEIRKVLAGAVRGVKERRITRRTFPRL